MADFPIPSFLENKSIDEIHQKMLEQLPEDIDKSEGGHPWNLTRPTAYVAAYMAEFVVLEAIRLIFPKYSEDYADTMVDHAETRGLERKSATYATGTITITGDENTEIPAGSSFSTASINGEPAIEFITTEDAVISSTGSIDVGIMAVESGSKGNVPANTIILKANRITGIREVTNSFDTTGGTEEESIESLQSRIMDYDAAQGVSFVGSEADYKRWTLEVDGTGNAVIIPAQDDTGLIQIVLTDANGNPANEELREAVYNHIMRPDAPKERLAPINGGNIEVIAPVTVTITINVTIETNGVVLESTIKKNMLNAISNYLIEATQDGEVRYTKIGSIISKTEGVEDYTSFTLNDGTANISLTNQQLPVITDETLIITIGTV